MTWLQQLIAKLFAPKTSTPTPPPAPVEKPVEQKSFTADRWMTIALKERGIHEVAGPKDNPRIIEYHKATILKATHDEVPWCSSFVNWVFLMAGLPRTKSAAAASWLDWGFVLKEPKYGCVGVKTRKGGHHVFFFMRLEERNGTPGAVIFGGNQNDSVCEEWIDLSTVIGWRWPKDYT